MNDRTQNERFDRIAIIFWVTLAIIFLNAVTLFLSYNVFATDAWLKFSNDTKGALIEFVRVVFIYVFLLVLFTGPFGEDAAAFFAFRSKTHSGGFLWALRILFGLLLVVIFVFVSLHHFVQGPEELNEKARTRLGDPASTVGIQRIPFIPYYFYSLLQYVIAAVVWSVWLYGSYIDVKQIYESRMILKKRKSPESNFCQDFKSKLKQYQSHVEHALSRYPLLFTFIAFLLLFEFLYGRSTLQSERAQQLALFTYGLFAIVLLGIIAGVGYFCQEVRTARQQLSSHKCRVDGFYAEFGLAPIWKRYRVTLGGQLLIWAITTVVATYK